MPIKRRQKSKVTRVSRTKRSSHRSDATFQGYRSSSRPTILTSLPDIRDNATRILTDTLTEVQILEKVYRGLQLILLIPIIVILYTSIFLALKIFPCLPFPFFLPVGLKNIFGRGSLKDVITTEEPERKPDNVDGDAFVSVKNMTWDFPWKQDNGIYWYGKGNVCSKTQKGRRADKTVFSEFFYPEKPSVIYIHGYSPGTTKRGFRETINWRGDDNNLFTSTNTLDLWIDKGYNCGIFYWNAQADELDLRIAERKIYNKTGNGNMRYLVRGGSDGKALWYEPGLCDQDTLVNNDKPIAVQFYIQYCQHFLQTHTAPIQIVGHSLGTQIALHSIRMMIENKAEKHVLPSRLTLLDPFCSELRVAQFKENLRYVAHKNNTKLAIETYASSIVGQGFLVSRTPVRTLKQLTYYSVINSSLIPWYSIKWRHISVVHYYFSSIVYGARDVHNRDETWDASIPHAGASLEAIRKQMRIFT